MRMSRLIGTYGVMVLAFCCAAGAHAAVRLVPKQYPTIQLAIDASVAGDTIEVAPGIYSEALNFGGRAIVVRSTAGASTTIVDPVVGRGFTANGLETAAARLEGFTLRGGSAGDGGGVYIESSSPTLVNCVITGNSCGNHGGGVHVASGNPRFVGCTVSLNTGWRLGGGVYVGGGSPQFENCHVTGNTLVTSDSAGGGVYVGTSQTVSFVGGSVSSNVALSRWTGISKLR